MEQLWTHFNNAQNTIIACQDRGCRGVMQALQGWCDLRVMIELYIQFRLNRRKSVLRVESLMKIRMMLDCLWVLGSAEAHLLRVRCLVQQCIRSYDKDRFAEQGSGVYVWLGKHSDFHGYVGQSQCMWVRFQQELVHIFNVYRWSQVIN